MEYCSVVVNRDNAVYSNYLFVGEDNAKVGDRAEKKFKAVFKQLNSTAYDALTEEELEGCLDQGYVEFDNFCICINWPDEFKVD